MRFSILLLLSLSLACSKKDAAPPADPEQAANTESTPTAEGAGGKDLDPGDLGAEMPPLPEDLEGDTPAANAPPVVKMLEAGEAPRKSLRWQIKPGFKQKVTADIGFAVDAIVSLLRLGSPNIVVSVELAMRATEVKGDGSARVGFEVAKADINWRQISKQKRIERLKAALVALRKVTGSYTLGSRGQVTDLEVSLPADATRDTHDMVDNLRWALAQMIPVFPEEPVGPGAKWTVQQGVMQTGALVHQLKTLELVKTQSDRLELTMTVRQTAATQAFQNPGTALPLKLTKLNGKANGSLTWDLAELAPRAARIESVVVKAVVQEATDPRETVASAVKLDRTLAIKQN